MKSLKIVFAVALVAATAACGSAKTTADPSASEVKRTPIEWQYLTDVRTAGSQMAGGFADDSLLKLGRQACTDLAAGTKIEDLVTQKIELAKSEAGATDEQASAFVASYVTKAIVNFCPEEAPK